MDVAALTAGAAALKTGLDTIRAALGLVKDVQGVLPAGEKKDAVGASLAEADRQLRIAEGQIAQGLGYELCMCDFPPTPMVRVGVQRLTTEFGQEVRYDVIKCRRCNRTEPPGSYQATDGTFVAGRD